MICVDLLITTIVESKMQDNYNLKVKQAHSDGSDLAIIGASRASHHYIPKVFEDSLGLTAFNYGIDGRNIYVHYAILKSLLAHSKQKPKIVLLDLNNVDINNEPGFNKERLSILYPYYKDSAINEILVDLIEPKELAFISGSGLVRHNSNLLQYTRDIYSNNKISKKGFEPLHNVWNKNLETRHNNQDIDPDKVRYLKKFIETCKQNNIELILVTSPSYALVGDQNWVNEIKKISEFEKIPYLFFEKDPDFLSHKEWFSDPTHLNETGALIFSNKIISKLK